MKSHLCAGGASENTQCAFKLYIVIEKGEEEERERERKTERETKKVARFWRSGITCGEERSGEGDEQGGGGRKTGGSAPTEFFGGITDLYFTPDLPSDVYVFNILDAQTARARVRASMHRCVSLDERSAMHE